MINDFPPCWLCFHPAGGPTGHGDGQGKPEAVDRCNHPVGDDLSDRCPCQGYVHPGKASA